MKAKKKKSRLRIDVLLIILLSIYVFFQIAYYVVNLNVDDIIIRGNTFLSDATIIETSEINSDTNFLFLSSNHIENKLTENVFIKEAYVNKNFFGDIEINIVESKVLFYYSYKSIVILEGDEKTDLENLNLGIPTLINYTPSTILSDFIENLSLIDQNLINKISEIEYSPNIKDDIMLDEERFIFKMNDGNTVHVNIINLEKFNNYDSILEIESSKGILYLDSSNDGNVFDIYE